MKDDLDAAISTQLRARAAEIDTNHESLPRLPAGGGRRHAPSWRTRVAVLTISAAAIAGATWAVQSQTASDSPTSTAAPGQGESTPEEGAQSADEISSDLTSTTSAAIAIDDPPSAEDIVRLAIDDGIMPDLTGWLLNDLGDGTGLLYEIHAVAGIQKSVYVANETVPSGIVVSQSPPAGTPLASAGAWTLEISDGGPVVLAGDLPADVLDFARAQTALEPDDPLLVIETDLGIAYKNDTLLFGLSCSAVDEAYRSSVDSRYDSACAG